MIPILIIHGILVLSIISTEKFQYKKYACNEQTIKRTVITLITLIIIIIITITLLREQ
jgi:hypothetical protein